MSAQLGADFRLAGKVVPRAGADGLRVCDYGERR